MQKDLKSSLSENKTGIAETEIVQSLQTERLILTPATSLSVQLEIEDHKALGEWLKATIPANWPPETLADALDFFHGLLTETPELVGWLGWYGVARDTESGLPQLVASGGFLGKPKEGCVEVGYSVLPQFQSQGYATEMVGELIKWAFEQADVLTIFADVEAGNRASQRVLIKLGFHEAGAGAESGHLRYTLEKENFIGKT